MTEAFDPTKNENLDENREASAAYVGDKMLDAAGLKKRIFFEERGVAGQWWFQDVTGSWCGFTGKMAETYMKQNGINAVREDNAIMSDLERITLHIATNHRVAYAGPIAGWKKGIQFNNGQRVLVTREPNIIEPKPAEDSIERTVIWDLLQRMFSDKHPDCINEGPDQLPYLLGWWKHALECLADPRVDHRGICMVLAGEAGCGKSLLKDLISLSMGGRECKPYRFMIGQENFNGEFIGSELWVIDDEQSMTDHKSRSEFGANIKKTVAERTYRIRGMMRDGVVLDMYRRLLICVNREPERLMVLPQLDDDIADKISVLLAHKHAMPMPVGSPEDKRVFWDTLTGELPHFIHWLLNEYTIDPALYGRFGVTHFHHPTLCSDLFQMSRERVLWEQIKRVMDFDTLHWQWSGGTTELRNLMASEDGPLSKKEINDLPAPQWFGKALKKIAQEFPKQCVQKKVAGTNKWFFCADDRDVMMAVTMARANAGRVRADKGEQKGE